jgi:two-component system, cell cycle sensor histidine kinase and response regulator CckA
MRPHLLPSPLWSALAANTSDFVGVMDGTGRALFMNRSVRGAPVAEVEGKLLEEFLAPERARQIRAMIEEVVITGAPAVNDSLRIRALDGSERRYVERCVPVDDPEAGRLFLLVRTEVTRLLEKEEALRESEERYRTLFDSNPDPVLVVRQSDAVIVAANDAAAKLFRLQARDVGSLEIGDLFVQGERVDVKTRFVANPETEYRGLSRQVRRDGSEVTTEIVDNPVWYEGLRARIVVARDVTQRERMEQQLRQAQRMESIGVFAGGVSHDFNNLLSVIVSCAEDALLAVEPPGTGSETVRLNLEAIREAARRGGALNRKLLMFSKQDPLIAESCDLKVVISDFLTILDRAAGGGRRLEVRHEADVLPIHADRTQIEQVLLNLVINARQALDSVSDPARRKAPVRIGTRVVVVGDAYREAHPWVDVEGTFVELSVHDQGPGMTEAVASRVFEPFFTTKPRGSGLGLSVVHGVAENHRGQSGVETQLGEGTTFIVLLPFRRGDSPHPTHGPQPGVRPGGAASGRVQRLLLADDEPVLLARARTALEAAGYEVVVASDGEEAVAVFEADPMFDLVVLDVVMPRLDGIAALRRMRELRPTQPALFVTGHALDASGELAELVRTDLDLLRKPFTQVELAARVRKALHLA